MSTMCELIDFRCTKCPFLRCYERGTCYECECFLDDTLSLDIYCDEELTKHPDCPLLKGTIITVKEDEGKLSIGVSYQ